MHKHWERYLELRRQFPAEFEHGAPPGLCLEEDAPVRAGIPLGVLEEHDQWLWVREWDGQRSVERPVYRDSRLREEIEGYFRLTEERPSSVQSPLVPLCLDRHTMLEFVRQTGRRVGLVFDNRIYYQVLADLIGGERPYVYARIIYPQRRSNGTVIVPVHTDEQGVRRFGVLQVFRHSLRDLSGGEFPRGFLAPGLSPEEECPEGTGRGVRCPARSNPGYDPSGRDPVRYRAERRSGPDLPGGAGGGSPPGDPRPMRGSSGRSGFGRRNCGPGLPPVESWTD